MWGTGIDMGTGRLVPWLSLLSPCGVNIVCSARAPFIRRKSEGPHSNAGAAAGVGHHPVLGGGVLVVHPAPDCSPAAGTKRTGGPEPPRLAPASSHTEQPQRRGTGNARHG